MHYRKGVLLVLTAGVMWSFQALIIRQIDGASAWAILFWRSLAMLPVTFGFLTWRSKGSPLTLIAGSGPAGIAGGIGLVVAMGGAILAFQSTTVANAEFLFAASPFIAAILGRVLLHETVPRPTMLAISVALFGVLIMVGDGLAAGAWFGNCAALASAFGFAAYSVALRWSRSDDSMPTSVIGGAFSVAIAALAARVTGDSLVVPMPDIAWCLLMGTVTLAGGMILYTLGSEGVPSAELTLLSNTEVLLAPFWVWLVMGESARPQTWLGGAILLAAITFNAFSGVRRQLQVS